jgi:hypothetical protein
VFVDGHLLQDQPSPYKHNDFPFTPIWGNRRGRDNAPYGVIRVIRDPQEDFNKRMSKALYALSTRRVVMEEGAVDDIEELREEVARPDSIIVLKKGYKERIEIHTDTEVAEEHLQYAEIDARMIQDLSGVTDELSARRPTPRPASRSSAARTRARRSPPTSSTTCASAPSCTARSS